MTPAEKPRDIDRNLVLVRRADGFTGDIYGALVEVCETAVLVSLSVMIAN